MPHTGEHAKLHASLTDDSSHKLRRRLIDLTVLLLLLYVIIPQINVFHYSLSIARRANGWWLLYGVLIALVTYLPAALTYALLAQYRLRFVRTVIVEIASSFLDHLLPAGIGSMSVNYSYLRHQNHDQTEAGVVVAANTLLGIVGLFLLVVIAAILNHTVLSQLRFSRDIRDYLWIMLAIVLLGVVIVTISNKVRHSAQNVIQSIHNSLSTYRHKPLQVSSALLSSMSLTVLYSLSLHACARATGLNLTFPHALFVLALGGVAGAIAPTPGGLIGVEAGLVAGLVAYGAPSSEALAATLLYRLVTYWFMLFLGLIVYGIIRQKGII